MMGCAVGGGPVIGFSARGAFIGGEASAGSAGVALTGGYESAGGGYARVDAALADPLGAAGGSGFGSCSPTDGLSARAGIGVGFDGNATGGASAGIAHVAGTDMHASKAVTVGVELGVRYVGGWQVVLLLRCWLHPARSRAAD